MQTFFAAKAKAPGSPEWKNGRTKRETLGRKRLEKGKGSGSE